MRNATNTAIRWTMTALMIGAIAGLASGCRTHGRGHRAGDPTRHVDRAMRYVDATEFQKEQAGRLSLALREQTAAATARKEALTKEFITLWSSDQPDRERCHQFVQDEMKSLTEDMHRLVDEALDLHASLTPEQRRKLSERFTRSHQHARR